MQQVDYIWLEEIEIIHATDAAVLIDDEGAEFWLPRSQLKDGEELEAGFSGDIGVARWLAKRKGFIE